MQAIRRPFNLPRNLTIDAGKIANGVTLEIVREYIRKHEEYLRRYEYLEALYKGFHSIFKEPEKEDWKPDYRLSVNMPKYMTDTFSGYGYGIAIKETFPDDDDVNQKVQNFRNDNEITDHENELIKKVCIYGHAFEYIYQDENSNTKLTGLNPMECFVVYDDTVKNRAMFAVRYGRHTVEGQATGELYGEIMTRESISVFDGEKQTQTKDNPYGYIPVVEWRMNDERMGLYEPAAGMIEALDFTLSSKANDVAAFAEAIFKIIGMEVSEDQIQMLRDARLFNMWGDDTSGMDAGYMAKPTADATQENLLDRLERLIFMTCSISNINDESFGSAVSGTALAYKMQAMKNLAASFDRKIEKSIRKRYKIFASLSTNIPEQYRDTLYKDMEIKFTRNDPKNLLEEAQIAQALTGMVSQETQLSVLSFVPDVQKEIDKIKENEKERELDSVVDRLMFDNGGTDDAEQS